jgi:coenzyme F420-0:L-glutamate ligase
MQKTGEVLIRGIKSAIITTHERGQASECAFPERLIKYILASLKHCPLIDGDILVISSKVVAVTQGSVRKVASEKEFNKLVESEADEIIGHGKVTLTMKNGIFIPWAGIDRSNVKKGFAVLWPEKPFEAAEKVLKILKKRYRLKKLGVIISDSHCIPLRKGIIGMALGYAGFQGVRDLRGKKDIYGNILKVTQQNIADMLATAAHLVTGEADEKMPFALVRNAQVDFTASKVDPKEPLIKKNEDLFAPLY